MTITDFFSISFLFSIAIIIFLTGCIYAYINFKMSEQDHKLSSMVNLVSILAQDLHFVKNKINNSQNDEPNVLQYSSQLVGGENISSLIDVSDNEDENENEDEDEDEDEDEEDDNEDEYDNEDEDENEDQDENDNLDFTCENTEEHIKLLNLSLANDNIDNNFQFEELNNYSDSADVKKIYFINDEENENENDNEIGKEENIVEEEGVTSETNNINDDLQFLKNVSISDLGDIQDLTAKTEYKKMSTNKLREVVVSKGIITDASKLKKNEILKLLGDE